MRKLLLCAFVLFCTYTVSAKTPLSKVPLMDTADKSRLVMLSLLFSTKRIPRCSSLPMQMKRGLSIDYYSQGAYILLVTFPKCANYNDEILVTTDPMKLLTVL